MPLIHDDDVKLIQKTLENNLNSYGFEFHPFKVAWYNSLVQPVFRLSYSEDTVGFLIISNPKMFENAFVPFIKSNQELQDFTKDPIDQCMMNHLSNISQLFPDHDIKVVYDFELHPNRRPKLVMQSVAHASGAAFFYHPKCVPDIKWPDKKIFGVCIHPEYGGWFALRAVAFFEDLHCPNLIQTFPKDVISSSEERLRLLELYNFHWEDWRFRDIISTSEKYSEMQIKYFSTPPGKRNEVIKDILNKFDNIHVQ